MPDLRYSTDHEWVRLDADGQAVIGISDFAQRQLGDIVYVELPAPGREVASGEEAAVVESVKAASDIRMPIAGRVTAVNESLSASPELINSHPESEGWLIKLAPGNPDHIGELMDARAYAEFIQQES